MLKRKLLLSLSLVSIQGCAALGIGGAYQTADTVTIGTTVVSYGATGKGLTDHAVSAATGKDCRMFNVLQHKKLCRIRRTYEVRNIQERDRPELSVETMQIINSLKEKEELNVTRLGKRQERHARKVRCARSRIKNACK